MKAFGETIDWMFPLTPKALEAYVAFRKTTPRNATRLRELVFPEVISPSSFLSRCSDRAPTSGKLVAHARGVAERGLTESAYMSSALGSGIHPVDGFAERLHEAHVHVAAGLEAVGVGDVHPHGLPAQARHVVGAGEDADPALVEHSKPSGGEVQPISTCPDISSVIVAAGPPVAIGLALRPSSRMNPSTTLWVDEPLVE